MPAKRQIKLNRKKKEPVEVKEVTLEEAIEEIAEEPIVQEAIVEETQVLFDRPQIKWEIVWSKWRTTVQPPRWRIQFEAQVAAVPLFKLPDDIRRYLVSNGLPTSVWRWDKEKLEKHNVNMDMIEKLKKFLSGTDY